jgi:hypothetical protein
MLAVTGEQVTEVIEAENDRFEIDQALSAAEREDHARMQVAIERILIDRGLSRLQHSLRRDRRGRPVQPASARGRVHPDG